MKGSRRSLLSPRSCCASLLVGSVHGSWRGRTGASPFRVPRIPGGLVSPANLRCNYEPKGRSARRLRCPRNSGNSSSLHPLCAAAFPPPAAMPAWRWYFGEWMSPAGGVPSAYESAVRPQGPNYSLLLTRAHSVLNLEVIAASFLLLPPGLEQVRRQVLSSFNCSFAVCRSSWASCSCSF